MLIERICFTEVMFSQNFQETNSNKIFNNNAKKLLRKLTLVDSPEAALFRYSVEYCSETFC